MRTALAFVLVCACAGLARADYSNHEKVPQLVAKLRSDYAFGEGELAVVASALKDAQRLPQLVELEQKAPEKTENWSQYSRRIDDSRVTDGAQALIDNAEFFARAESEFGVAPSVIAAIMEVETRVGRITGKVRVLDSLATQGFDHPTRSPFFLGELAEFFAFCRDFGYAPTEPLGSYAGAMGIAQFMPSNYRRLAVDYDGDGRRDLWTLADAIGSIGHYLTSYNKNLAWTRGEPIAVRAHLERGIPAGAEFNTKAPMYFAGDVARAGIVSDVPLPPQTPVGLIQLPLEDGTSEYWLGLGNFYAVMTYNPRTFYAMAVTQLAGRIAQLHAAAPP
jgi:membrane-bound lytic murein transglycosylase B